GRALDAVEPFGEDSSKRGLPCSAGPCKEVRLADLSGGDGVPQRADDRLLPDDLVEVLWPVLPVERGHPVDLTGGPGLLRPPVSGEARKPKATRRRALHCCRPWHCERSEPGQIREEAALRIARRCPG